MLTGMKQTAKYSMRGFEKAGDLSAVHRANSAKMFHRSAIVFALAGLTAGFSTTMAVDEDCRQVVYAGAAAAVAAPLFRAIPPAAKVHNGFAPAITIMDHRGCSRGFGEYKGGSSGHQDDDMFAAKQLAESLSLKAKGIDGPYTSNLGA